MARTQTNDPLPAAPAPWPRGDREAAAGDRGAAAGDRGAGDGPRIAGIDAYRGLVMFLMLAEVLRCGAVSQAIPESRAWQFLAKHQSHVPWFGCHLHDLIQPSFSFLVGVALPFSLASRRRRGHGLWRTTLHAAWRAAVLVALGVFLRSQGRPQTNFTFEDTLSQIGLGYFPLFLLALVAVRWQFAALVVILLGYWLAFVLYPAPGPDFDYQAVGVASDWPYHAQGLAGHFNLNSNLAWAFDTWFLNLFPRATPFTGNGGGYSTLSFIPTLGTMLLGLLAGGWLQQGGSWKKQAGGLLAAAGACLALGWAADATGACPSIKKLWTPAWVLFSGGWCLLILLVCYALCDLLRWRWWAAPLTVIGANSIVAYCLAQCAEGYVEQNLRTHLGSEWAQVAGPAYAPLIEGAAVLLCFYAVLAWLCRRRVFVRI